VNVRANRYQMKTISSNNYEVIGKNEDEIIRERKSFYDELEKEGKDIYFPIKDMKEGFRKKTLSSQNKWTQKINRLL